MSISPVVPGPTVVYMDFLQYLLVSPVSGRYREFPHQAPCRESRETDVLGDGPAAGVECAESQPGTRTFEWASDCAQTKLSVLEDKNKGHHFLGVSLQSQAS